MSETDMQPYSEDDARLLRDTAARWAEANATPEHSISSRQAPPQAARTHWSELAERGWLGLGVPESAGGFGGGVSDLGIVMECLGRTVRHEPYLSTVVLCGQLLARLGGASQRLADLISGERTFALAYAEPQLGFARGPIATIAAGASSEPQISGSKSFVLDGAGADTFIVSATDRSGALGLYLVDADASGVAIKPYRMIDGRWCADVDFDGARGVVLGDGRDAAETLEAVLDLGAIAAGWDAMGSMTSVIDLCVQYLKVRHQFGQPLESFQVLRHRMADMYIPTVEVRSLLDKAGDAMGAPARDRAASVSVLKIQTCRAARFVGQQGVQLHGGMGMTDELMISHYFKRLMTIESLFGDAEFHLRRLEALDLSDVGTGHPAKAGSGWDSAAGSSA